MTESPPLVGIIETSVYVSDLEAAEVFYGEVLGLEIYSRLQGRHVFFRVGGGMLLVFDGKNTRLPGDLPSHGAEGAGHFALAVNPNQWSVWKKRFAEYRIPIESEVDWGAGRSIYFRDPSGNSVELVDPAIWGL